MKKFAMLLAAGVIALGASAQAASVASADTYAVITIPVYPGNNLIGVSVEPITEGTNLASVMGLDSATWVKKLNDQGNEYISEQAGSITVFSVGDAYWVTGDQNSPDIYEVGIENTNATVVASSGLTPAVGTVPSTWKLSETSLDAENDGSNRPSRAPKIHVWDPAEQTYVKYWLSTEGWKAYSNGDDADDETVHAAQGVFFDLPSQKTISIKPTVQ